MEEKDEIEFWSSKQYWLFQIAGWGFFLFLLRITNTDDDTTSYDLSIFLSLVFIVNLLISHFYRLVIIRYKWISKPIGVLILYSIISSIVLGIVFSVTTNLIGNEVFARDRSLITTDALILGGLIYFIWSILYFSYLLFYKARRIEFKNMQMSVLNAEAKLKNLRSQLNPHFMFNAMNSIRALVDEDPEKSKMAITQLSNVLRNALIHSKKDLVSLKDELQIVDDYLSLEKIRYEERLQIEKNVDKSCLSIGVPPLLLQTITENAIKHGISKLMKGGKICIEVYKNENFLVIEIANSGKLDDSTVSETGIGVENTKKRLKLKYGSKASFRLFEEGDFVKSEIIIPIKTEQ